ncbi:MAG TPA: membrane protein insertion efficiency factor YidD [Candidatus Omnitrophica bacterium]|nr:membrane protein insertion efficiency factor YidD [Candidatus Omnitrophota bacterium]
MKLVLSWAINFYKRALSPFLPHACRFTPTCSSYFLEAVEKHGFLEGSILGFKRIGRCHPLSVGGYDPIPTKGGPDQLIQEALGRQHKG